MLFNYWKKYIIIIFIVIITVVFGMTGMFLESEAAADSAMDRKWSIEGGVRYSLLYPSGKMGVKKGGSSSQSDLSDLGIDSSEGTFGISLAFQYGRPKFFFSGQKSSYSGIGSTAKDISKGPITIPAGTAVSTSMDLGIYSIVGTYNMLPGKYRLGLGLGLMALGLDVSYTSLDDGAQLNFDDTYPMPLLAINASVKWKSIEWAALIGGAYIKYNDNEVGYLNADIAARYPFYRGKQWSAMASLGFRYIGLSMDVKADEVGFIADLNFTGPYIGVRFKY